MTVNDAVEKLGLEVLNLADGERQIEGGYAGDLLSWVMGRAESGNAWVTIMSNSNIIAVAVLIDMSCIILSENSDISPDVINTAKDKGVNLLRSEKTTFELCAELSSL